MPFDFGIKDTIDILLVALMLYYIYRLMKESRSLNVFIGIMVFVLIWLFVSQVLEMRLMGSILDKLVSVGVIALIVLFQEEIRKFLYTLGAHQRFRSFLHYFKNKDKEQEEDKETIMPIVMACMNMARQKVGALIVVERGVALDDIVETGDKIDAAINQRLMLDWASRRHRMPSPSSSVRRRGASLLPTRASSACAYRPKNLRLCWRRKCRRHPRRERCFARARPFGRVKCLLHG